MQQKAKKLLLSSLLCAGLLLHNTTTAQADSIILNKDVTDGVNVREEMDNNSPVLGGIEDFTIYEIKGETDEWYEIDFNGKTGYVGKYWFYRLNHTSLLDETNLKKEPDSDSENLTDLKLRPKTKLTILQFLPDSEFVKVSFDEDFKDNKEINDVDLASIENSDLLYKLADTTDSGVNTVTLDGGDGASSGTPEVVTLADDFLAPETVQIEPSNSDGLAADDNEEEATAAVDSTEETSSEEENADGPIEGYVKLSSLAIANKNDDELNTYVSYYKELNDQLAAHTRAIEEAQALAEANATQYVTTTTYNTQLVNGSQATTAPATVAQSQPTNTINVPVTGSQVGIDLYNFGVQFVGNPYVLGGTSLTNGIDCSGFTMRIYQQIGVGLPHRAQSQQRYGVEIPFGQEQAGDLVFFGTSLNNITHVGMADGNGNMVHASSPRVGIVIGPIRNPISIKRIVY